MNKQDLALNNISELLSYKTNQTKSSISCVQQYKQDLGLNNQQGLICRKTQPTNNRTANKG